MSARYVRVRQGPVVTYVAKNIDEYERLIKAKEVECPLWFGILLVTFICMGFLACIIVLIKFIWNNIFGGKEDL